MTAQRRGNIRRRAIYAYLWQVQRTDPRGARAAEIARAVGYQGHSIRGRHLSRMLALEQGDDGRWRIVE